MSLLIEPMVLFKEKVVYSKQSSFNGVQFVQNGEQEINAQQEDRIHLVMVEVCFHCLIIFHKIFPVPGWIVLNSGFISCFGVKGGN